MGGWGDGKGREEKAETERNRKWESSKMRISNLEKRKYHTHIITHTDTQPHDPAAKNLWHNTG